MIGAISRVAVAMVLVAAVAGCHSSSTTSQLTPSGSGSFTATIDGVNFVADASTITVSATSFAVPGSVTISGTQINSTTNTTTLQLALGYIPGTGTYTLGVNQSTNTGGTATVQTTTSSSFGSWVTGFTGSSGTVTITTINSSQIAGTFQFTAQRSPGQSGAATSVTNGKFTVPANGFTVAPASTPGSFLNATLGGSAFVSASESGQGTGSSFGLLGTSTNTDGVLTSFSIVSTGNITPGSYPVNPPPAGGAYFVINVTIGNSSFGGQGADSGTVTITSNSGGRIKGTLSGTFGGLSVTGCSFDIKLGGA